MNMIAKKFILKGAFTSHAHLMRVISALLSSLNKDEGHFALSKWPDTCLPKCYGLPDQPTNKPSDNYSRL